MHAHGQQRTADGVGRGRGVYVGEGVNGCVELRVVASAREVFVAWCDPSVFDREMPQRLWAWLDRVDPPAEALHGPRPNLRLAR